MQQSFHSLRQTGCSRAVIGTLMFNIFLAGCSSGGGGGNDTDTGGTGTGPGGGSSPTSFIIGGTVSMLDGTLVLQNNGGDDITITSNGSFSFPTPVANGQSYIITIASQPANQNCMLSNSLSGVAAGSWVSDTAVNCAYKSGTPRTATKVVAGMNHTCALLDNGMVKCWGRNTGILGYGDSHDRGDDVDEMGQYLAYVNLGSGRTAVDLVAGPSSTCALLDNGQLKCWGANHGGQLGLGGELAGGRGARLYDMGDSLPAIDLGSGRTVVEAAAGSRHVCARLDNGSVKCWGENLEGQLGLGDTESRGDQPGEMGDNLPTVDLGMGRTATRIVAGHEHSCAQLDNAQVKCWGRNSSGRLGIGDTTNRGDNPNEMGDNLPAVDFGTGRTAVKLAAGESHTCVVLDNATVKCWGESGVSRLGVTTSNDRGDAPGEMGDALPIVNLGTGRTAVDVASGARASHTCVLLDNSTVKCWGSATYGKLGWGGAAVTPSDNFPVTDLGTSITATQLTVGWNHTCARLSDGAVKCWGLNGHLVFPSGGGQLGLGDRLNRGGTGTMGDSLPFVDLGY